MKIKTSQLSKTSLVAIIDALRKEGVIRDDLIIASYKRDLTSHLISIKRQLEKIESKLNRKKVSMQNHNKLVRKYNQLTVSGKKKLSKLEKLESKNENAIK